MRPAHVIFYDFAQTAVPLVLKRPRSSELWRGSVKGERPRLAATSFCVLGLCTEDDGGEVHESFPHHEAANKICLQMSSRRSMVQDLVRTSEVSLSFPSQEYLKENRGSPLVRDTQDKNQLALLPSVVRQRAAARKAWRAVCTKVVSKFWKESEISRRYNRFETSTCW